MRANSEVIIMARKRYGRRGSGFIGYPLLKDQDQVAVAALKLVVPGWVEPG
jgi:hypothetical protein